MDRLDKDLIEQDILNLAGSMTREKIADCVGVSRSRVSRTLAKYGVRTGQLKKYPKSIRDQVLYFYESHTIKETQKQFPSVRVRSIIDRYCASEKLRKWDFKDDLYLVQNVTIMTNEQIAKKLKTTKESVDRRFHRAYKGLSSKHLNAMPYRLIKHHVSRDVVITKSGTRNMVKWVDFEKALQTDNETIRTCVKALALFQRWVTAYV